METLCCGYRAAIDEERIPPLSIQSTFVLDFLCIRDYYRVLKLCSQGWHEGQNEIVPWWNYFLGVLRSAYQEFQRQVESVGARPAKSDLVRQTVRAQLEPFTLADMAAQLPAASSQLIKKVLAEMKQARRVRLAGRGSGARWEFIR